MDTPPSSNHQDSRMLISNGVRLLRRPTTDQTTSSTPNRHLTALETTSNDLNSKIGAPIIRPVSSRTSLPTHQRLGESGQRELMVHARPQQQQTDSPSNFENSDFVVLTGESIPSPSFDLSSDSQWPSIGGDVAEESGRGQGAWPVLLVGDKGKGWSSIVKSAPSGKNLSVRAEGPISSTAEDGDVWVSGEEVEEEMVAGGSDSNQKKKKKKKKKKKSGEKAGQQPPQEKKLDKPAQLDIFEYAKQVPVRPVLNRKDTKTSTKAASATARNMLDSTAPAMRRGKEREQPKAKKPTHLRKVIEKEKALKKELREQGLAVPPDLDVMKPTTDESDHCTAPAESENTGQESVTIPTPQSPVATPTFEINPEHSTTPTNQSSHTNTSPLPAAVPKRPIHGRRFREYCSHVVTDEINSVVEALLLDLVRFQDRQHQKDPVKAKSKRRYVCGLREVHKHIEVGKIKCVIVPPNLDHIQSTGGIDERVSAILSLCGEQGVQVVHAMSRRRLAVVLKKKFKIGCVGIFSYDGAEAHYRKMKQLIEEATELYRRIAHPQPPEGSTEEDIPSTSDPQLLESGSDNSEDEDSIPEPGNGTGTHKSADVVWEMCFPKKEQDPSTSEIVVDVTSFSTNQFSATKDDTTIHRNSMGSEYSMLGTEAVEESGDVGRISSLVLPEQNMPYVLDKGFRWNLNAAEFVPS